MLTKYITSIFFCRLIETNSVLFFSDKIIPVYPKGERSVNKGRLLNFKKGGKERKGKEKEVTI